MHLSLALSVLGKLQEAARGEFLKSESQNSLLKKLSASFDYILTALMALSAIILAILMLGVCWDVFARSAMGRPLIWLLEFTEYGLLYMTFLCTAWVLKNEAHVNSDLLLVALRSKHQALLNVLTSFLGAIICLTLCWFGVDVSWEKLQNGAYQPTAIQPPDFPIFIIIPIGFFLLFVQFLRRACDNWVSWRAARNTKS
jgi:TRAP-type C4-dicarboxylate transport system permease small subunit